MIVKYNVVGYLVGEGFRNLLKNKKSTIASLVIICATMIVFGIFFAITENINHIIQGLEDVQGIQVFIVNEASENDVKDIGERIRNLEGVSTVTYVSENDALDILKEGFGEEKQELLNGMEGVLPVSYKVTFTDLSYNKQVQEEISQWEYIKNITNNDETTNKLMSIGNGVRIVSACILAFLIIVSIFIISNTIKLTVHARRKEISIMKYVGATNSFIRWPFIVEGIVIGIISSLISLLIIGGGYNFISQKVLQSNVIDKLEISMVSFNDMFSLIIIVYLILGIGIGVIGSSISMRKYLEV